MRMRPRQRIDATADREKSIVDDVPATFEIKENPRVDASQSSIEADDQNARGCQVQETDPIMTRYPTSSLALLSLLTSAACSGGGGGDPAASPPPPPPELAALTVYVVNKYSHDVTTFSIDPTTGALSEVGSAVAAGVFPASVTVLGGTR